MPQLLPNAEFLNNDSVPLNIGLFKVIQEPAPLTDEFQEPTSRMMILFVHFEVIGQIFDPIAQKGNLDLR